MQPYLNEDHLALLFNLGRCEFYDTWDMTGADSGISIKTCRDFIDRGYLDFKFNIQDVQYIDFENNAEQDDMEAALKNDKKYMKVFQRIFKNWKAKKPLFSNIELTPSDLEFLDDCVHITVRRTKQTEKQVSRYLDEYLQLYEAGFLYQNDKNTVQPSYHLKKFVSVLAYYTEKYGKNRVSVDIEMGFDPKTGTKFDSGWDEKPIVLPHKHEYRFTEFFLLMEQKGYIELLEMVSAERYVFPYKYVVNILRDPNEILNLEENWHRYGTLCLQPTSGHIFNGNIKPRLTPNSAPFKLVEALIKAPEKEFAIEELESFIFSADEKSVSAKQSKTRIQDAAKRARDALKMNEVASSVNIFSKGGCYWLGPVPSRK